MSWLYVEPSHFSLIIIITLVNVWIDNVISHAIECLKDAKVMVIVRRIIIWHQWYCYHIFARPSLSHWSYNWLLKYILYWKFISPYSLKAWTLIIKQGDLSFLCNAIFKKCNNYILLGSKDKATWSSTHSINLPIWTSLCWWHRIISVYFSAKSWNNWIHNKTWSCIWIYQQCSKFSSWYLPKIWNKLSRWYYSTISCI